MREGELCFYPYMEKGEFCAVTHLRRYLEKQGRLKLLLDSKKWDEPLIQKDGREVKYDWLLKEMKRAFDAIGVDSRFIGTHSYRSGGAQEALNRGVPKYLVKRQGGWVSDCVDSYFMPSFSQLTRSASAVGLGRARANIRKSRKNIRDWDAVMQ
jgi:hypothetical protein